MSKKIKPIKIVVESSVKPQTGRENLRRIMLWILERERREAG